MKKIAILLACVLTAGVTAMFTGCAGGPKKQATVMNLSVNPEIELILDTENKVVSVNALNEEGNLIVQAEVFVGLTAEEAAKKFTEVCEETGYIVEGQANEIKIAISGAEKAATELFNSVKAQVDAYLTEENLTATLTKAAAITEENLRALVTECEPYLDAAKMDYQELVAALQASRQETKDLYSEELKQAYYTMKEAALRTAEFDALQEKLGVAEQFILSTAKTTYENAMQSLTDLQNSLLISESSLYQQSLAAFQTAKTEYLNFKNYVQTLPEGQVTAAINQQLSLLENVLSQAEAALAAAKQTAEESLALAKTQVTQIYTAVLSTVEDYAGKQKQYASEIAAKQQAAKAALITQFEADYAAAIAQAENAWEAMEQALEEGYVAE